MRSVKDVREECSSESEEYFPNHSAHDNRRRGKIVPTEERTISPKIWKDFKPIEIIQKSAVCIYKARVFV